MPRKINAEELRSYRWFGRDNMRGFSHRSRMKQTGFRQGRLYRQAGHRHRQYLERDQPLSHPPARARRSREARRVAGRRLPGRDPGPLHHRDVHEAEPDALPQSARDGNRRGAAQPSRRWRGADGRLRQDHSRTPHGRDQHEHPGRFTCPAARCCAAIGTASRSAAAPTCWKILDRALRGHDHRERFARRRRRHCTLAGILHDHGYRVHDDCARRSSRHDSCPAHRPFRPWIPITRAWPWTAAAASSIWFGTISSRPTS